MENQLKAELRIGNYLFDRNNRLCQVKELSESITAPAIKGARTSLPNKPIPLSEDVLLRLGFEIDSVDRPILYADYKVMNPITHDYMIELKNVDTGWFYRNGYFKIDYVHQLQNLYFALCGEELTFKN